MSGWSGECVCLTFWGWEAAKHGCGGDTTWDGRSVRVPHTTTSHRLTLGASRCCTVAGETRKRNCTKATSSLSSWARPLGGGGRGEGGVRSFWLCVCVCVGGGNADTQPAPVPTPAWLFPCVLLALHSATLPSFTLPSAPAPKGSFHFLEVKMTSPLQKE